MFQVIMGVERLAEFDNGLSGIQDTRQRQAYIGAFTAGVYREHGTSYDDLIKTVGHLSGGGILATQMEFWIS